MKNLIKIIIGLTLSFVSFALSLYFIVNYDMINAEITPQETGAPKVIIFTLVVSTSLWLVYSINLMNKLYRKMLVIYLILFVSIIQTKAQTLEYKTVIAETYEDGKRTDSSYLKLVEGVVILGIKKVLITTGTDSLFYEIEEITQADDNRIWIQFKGWQGHIIFYEDYIMHCIPFMSESGDIGMYRNKLMLKPLKRT